MTAIRSFPNAPLAPRTRLPLGVYVPTWVMGVWYALERAGQRRAARELDAAADRRALGDPVQARELRAAAAECRRVAAYSPTPFERSSS